MDQLARQVDEFMEASIANLKQSGFHEHDIATDLLSAAIANLVRVDGREEAGKAIALVIASLRGPQNETHN